MVYERTHIIRFDNFFYYYLLPGPLPIQSIVRNIIMAAMTIRRGAANSFYWLPPKHYRIPMPNTRMY